MANYVIDSFKLSDTYVFTTPYGTCDTEGSAAVQVVSCSNFKVLETGARISVKFTNALTASSPTLNVNSTGAKNIYFRGAAITSSYRWGAGSVVDFIYDGTQWNMCGSPLNSTYSVNNATITLSAGTGLSGGGSFTTNQSSAGTITYSLSTSGVTASSYGPSANKTLSHSGTFTVPYITFDAYGRATAASNITYTLPASGNTDTNVKSDATTSTYYLTGSTSSSNTTGTLVKRSTVYVNTSGNIVANNIPATGLIWQSF